MQLCTNAAMQLVTAACMYLPQINLVQLVLGGVELLLGKQQLGCLPGAAAEQLLWHGQLAAAGVNLELLAFQLLSGFGDLCLSKTRVNRMMCWQRMPWLLLRALLAGMVRWDVPVQVLHITLQMMLQLL